MASSRPFTVIVEGNIGSGKSTCLNAIRQQNRNVEVFDEPVAKWQNIKGHNLFQMMYEDPQRWSMAFQSYAQLTMLEVHNKMTTAPIKIMERSIYSGRHCFIENHHQAGMMPTSEYTVLCEWFDFLRSSPEFNLHVDLVVYLRTTPKVAFERIKKRSRSEEKVIPMEYLEKLHDLHEDWVSNKAALPAELLVIDADEDLATSPKLFAQILDKIEESKENVSTSKLWKDNKVQSCAKAQKLLVDYKNIHS
eukprot:maker-scaffold130_size324016-snap-gene-1.11 protein:Tk07097 transcript:maker-scaffold130_size324016-snap-gene-1.11-mRNA-1 annotation:"deoxynucleoside kinase"